MQEGGDKRRDAQHWRLFTVPCLSQRSLLLRRLLCADIHLLQLLLASCRRLSQGDRAESCDLCRQKSTLRSGASPRLGEVFTKPPQPPIKTLLIEKFPCIRSRWQSRDRLDAQKATAD